MDGNAAREDNRRMLKRIVALLYALASVAERLCELPRPLRGLVFWVLWSAEAIARDFVMDTALDQGAAATPAVLARHGNDSAADARRLAASFRALAVVLDRLVDADTGHDPMRLIRLCAALAAYAAASRLSAGARVRRQPCRTAPGFAVERCDSS
jgi:hypothetical protein